MSDQHNTALPNDNDTKRINALLREKLNIMRVELRTSKQKQAVVEDALSEMRAEHRPTRALLVRLWSYVEDQEIRIPHNLRVRYAALLEGDSYDIQPMVRCPGALNAIREGWRSSKKVTRRIQGAKRAAVPGGSKNTILLHAHAYNMEDKTLVLGDNESRDEATDSKGTNIASSPTIQPKGTSASLENVMATRKRKASRQDGSDAKKIKSSVGAASAKAFANRPVTGAKRNRATKSGRTMLEKQEVGKLGDRDAAGDDV